jgi:uncharacterized membrane protein YczE|tara:strand:+ start:138 stop:467 length:330 start_codon:yes stop_codon:yes gene_type:complete
MDERDFHLAMRAKRQIHRETELRSMLIFGLLFSAALRFLGAEFPFLYLRLFVFLLVSLIFSSELIANFGLVSKDNLIKVIEKQLYSDPEMLTRYLNRRSRSKVGSQNTD